MLSASFLDTYRDRQPEWGFNGLGYVVYKRTYARPLPDGTTEEWFDTVLRVVNGAQAIGAGLTDQEEERLFSYIFDLKALPAGRGLWQLGTENVERLGGDSLVNCWFTNLDTPEDFGFLFNQLMLGGGVGFATDSMLGVIKQGGATHEPDAHDSDFIVPDKREGWRALLEKTIEAYLSGESFTYSTVLVRPEGAPIKTFGGVASGPGILVEGVERIVGILDGAVGRNLTSVETLDIANAIGAIVVSGNVRRSAQIALGKAWDEDYLQAKRWDLGTIPAWRAMSNNTVYLDHPDDLGPTFWRGYLGDGEPYGLYNLQASRAYGRTGEEAFDSTIEGVNPCGEIPLGHHESCNLAELVLPRFEDEGEMKDAAILLYKVQKAIAALPFSDEKTNEIAHSNMRLGLGVTGVAQAMERLPWLDRTYDYIKTYDAFWSGRRDMPESVRLTTVKPSGTLSLLAGVTPGAHPGFSRFHVRRIRMSTNDPVFAYAQKTGYPWEFVEDFEGNQDSRTAVVEFPCEFPEGTVLAEDLNAVQQLELQAVLQKTWADNAVSITIYYEREELEDIKAYLHSHWSDMKGVSFLLKTDHGFAQAPLEALTRDDYEVRAVGVHGHSYRVSSGLSDLLDGEECADGACPIR